MIKDKVYNLFLAEVMPRRKSCPNCNVKLVRDNSIVSMGGYHSGKYYRGAYACGRCYVTVICSTFKRGVYQLKSRSGHSVHWLKPDEQVTVY